MSERSTTQVVRLKEDVARSFAARGDTGDDAAPVPPSAWFSPPAATPVSHRVVLYADIASTTETQYEEWRRVPLVDHSYDFKPQLERWITETPTPTLANLLDAVPRGLHGSFEFTPWQRLSIAVMSRLPFAVTSRVSITEERLQEHCSTRTTSCNHKGGMGATFSMPRGSFPRCILCDIPTAGGKTAWSCALAFMAVSPSRFPELRHDYRVAALHTAYGGLPELFVARLVLVAPTPTTWDHFVTTLTALLPEMQRLAPQLRFHLWVGMSKKHSVAAATDPVTVGTDDVFVWVHPMDQRSKILRASPNIAVVASVMDEYCVPTPREKYRTTKSPVLHTIITQATPQALVEATSGHTSWLKEMFGGTLSSPSQVERLLRFREFTNAHLAMEQVCKLDLFTVTPFRARIRDDLHELVPRGLDIFFVRSRRVTIASHLSGASADFVPASLLSVVSRVLVGLTTTQAQHLHEHIQPSLLSLDQVRTALNTLPHPDSPAAPRQTFEVANPAQHAARGRLLDRLDEFRSACPICFEEGRDTLMIYGCCGFCVCYTCWTRTRRCPHCRADILGAPAEAAEEPRDHVYPREVVRAPSFAATLAGGATALSNNQLRNLAGVLLTMRAHGRKRLLIVIEVLPDTIGLRVTEAELQRISTAVGVDLVTPRMTSMGTGFRDVKARFDGPDERPMAIVSFMDTTLLVGTNLDVVDGVVTVGHISSSLMTQTLGRVFRPRASRDNTALVPLVRIFS
jgi:hypothetical protein